LKVVAVISAVGGAGSTTVAAHIAAGLATHKRRTLSIDFCTENMLRLFFGMAWNDHGGFASDLLNGKDWHTAAYRSGGGLDFVPFGQLKSENDLDRLTDWLKSEPHWFRHQLSSLQLHPETIIVCDCPRMPAALRAQALSAANLVLMITAPDTVSYATAARVTETVTREGGPETVMVLNGFDPARRLDRDISVLLRTQHKQSFAPVVIHRDESVREALACKQTVFDFAPSSQAAYEFSALATWALARLGHGGESA
jgi:cellulose synthase operon protein YhjQ